MAPFAEVAIFSLAWTSRRERIAHLATLGAKIRFAALAVVALFYGRRGDVVDPVSAID